MTNNIRKGYIFLIFVKAMLRISLIGPGDIEFHYKELLNITDEQLQTHIKGLAKALAQSEAEIELLPDKGICFEIAKSYKSQRGKSVIGSIPKDDKAYGIAHLQPYINEPNLFDRFINTGDWKQQNRLKALLGDVVLFLGKTFGTDLELNYGLYIYKLMRGFKQGIKTAQYLHEEVRAGKTIQYTTLIYTPFLKSGKLEQEIETYTEKYNINIIYINNPKELEKSLSTLSPASQH